MNCIRNMLELEKIISDFCDNLRENKICSAEVTE